jgi:polyribonucleotide nucleotidyltransferase
MSEQVTAQVGDKQIVIETGKLAKQADGAVTVRLGETIVIVAAVAATKAKEGQDFFSHLLLITAKKRLRRGNFRVATSNAKAGQRKKKSLRCG